MNKLLVIDGNAIIHRAYHALPAFKTFDGVPTNALYGFLSMLFKISTELKPTHIIICFDTPKPTFRKEMFAGYQAHRPKMDENLVAQIPFIRDAITAAGITYLEKEGYEADDVIGTISAKYGNDNTILILTGDRDIMQLVTEHVNVITPLKGITTTIQYDEPAVKAKLGIEPKQIPDWKALAGDNSDNYGGAKGIGPKTAVSLIDSFKTIENMFDNIDKRENERVRKLLIDSKENILLSKQLAQIETNVPIEIDIDSAKFDGFNPGLKKELERFQMKTLRERIFPESAPVKPVQETKNKVKDTPNKQKGLFGD